MDRIENQPMGIIIEIKNAVPDLPVPGRVPVRRVIPYVPNPFPQREIPVTPSKPIPTEAPIKVSVPA